MFILDKELDQVIKLLEEFKTYAIYFFESIIDNEFKSDNNIEIAFLTDDFIDDYSFFKKIYKLCDVFQRQCKLIDLKKASTIKKIQVIEKGQVIYCSDSLKQSYFEMKCFKEYALLKEESYEVLDVIKKTGNVYGKGYFL